MESGELSPGGWKMVTSGGERENCRTQTHDRAPL